MFSLPRRASSGLLGPVNEICGFVFVLFLRPRFGRVFDFECLSKRVGEVQLVVVNVLENALLCVQCIVFRLCVGNIASYQIAFGTEVLCIGQQFLGLVAV